MDPDDDDAAATATPTVFAATTTDTRLNAIEATLQALTTAIQVLQPVAPFVQRQPQPPSVATPVTAASVGSGSTVATDPPRRRLDPSILSKLGADVTLVGLEMSLSTG